MYQLQGEQKEVMKQLLKMRNLYTVLFLVTFIAGAATAAIPAVGYYIMAVLLVLSGFFAGMGMLSINCYRYTKTNGAKQGGGLWWWCLFLFGFIILPLITVVVVRNIRPLAGKLLGVVFE